MRNLFKLLLINNTKDYNYQEFINELTERRNMGIECTEILLEELKALRYTNITEDELCEFFNNL